MVITYNLLSESTIKFVVYTILFLTYGCIFEDEYVLYRLLYIVGWGPGNGVWESGWSLVVTTGIHLDCVICIPKLNLRMISMFWLQLINRQPHFHNQHYSEK